MNNADLTLTFSLPKSPKPIPPAVQPEAPKTPYRAPSRIGLVPVSGHFPKEVRRQMKQLGATYDRTIQDLLAEAINDLFAKHGKPPACPRER